MIWSSDILLAQQKVIMYDFLTLPQTLLENPAAKFEANSHVGIPLVSKVHIKANTFGISAHDLFSVDNQTFNIKLENFINSRNKSDYLTINQQLEIFSLGFRSSNGIYWSGGMYQELDLLLYYPESFVDLLWYGNADNLNRAYNLSDFRIKADLLNVYHIGLSKQINNKIAMGFRGKIYMGLANISSLNNKGYFVTNESDISSSDYMHYNHNFVDLNGKIHTSGFDAFIDDSQSSDDVFNSIKKKLIMSPNVGFGIDFGVVYDISKASYLTASILDLGFINYRSEVNNYKLNGNFSTDGVTYKFPNISDTGGFDWDNIKDNFENDILIEEDKKTYISWRSPILNLSYRYNFGYENSIECDCYSTSNDYINGLGLQFQTIFRPYKPQSVITAFYNRKLSKNINTKFTYSIDKYSFTNFGLGLSVDASHFNSYLMLNNLFALTDIYKAQSLSLQLGFNLIFR